MKKLYNNGLLLLMLLANYGFSQERSQPLKIGEVFDVNISAHQSYRSPITGYVFEYEFKSEGSSYVKLHFKNFDLAEGDYLEISSPKTGQKLYYSGGGQIIMEGKATMSDFWSASIFGDEAKIKLYSNGFSTNYGFDIDKVAYGFSEKVLEARSRFSICGKDDKVSAACHEGTEMFEKSKAVCRLVIGGGGACTGWLIGSAGHIMTNNHCVGNASAARNVEVLFNYQTTSCSGDNAQSDLVAMTSELVKTSVPNDYSLLKIPVNPTDKYGYLSFRSTPPVIGERIYIAQHPGGRRKELAVKDDQAASGVGTILGNAHRTTYKTDTEAGSSGSPVLAYDSNLVIALHNTGGCPNGGMRNTDVIDHLGNDIPPDGIDGGGIQANFSTNVGKSCDGMVKFTDLSRNATKWSWDFGDGNSSTEKSPSHEYKKSGDFKVVLTVEDASGKKDTKEAKIKVILLDAPEAEGENICKNESATLKVAGGSGEFNWFDKETGGNLLGIGETFTTEKLKESTDFYVSATEKVPVINVGPKDNSIGDGEMHNEENYGLIFTANKDFVLKSVKVFAENEGEREFAILDKQEGQVLVSKKVELKEGEQTVDLNLEIPAGVGMFIQIKNTPTNLYRNSAGAKFPYKVDDLVSITGSNAENYYYYFYDWKVQEKGCSSKRTKVSVEVKDGPEKPSIEKKNHGLLLVATSGHDKYQWFRNEEKIKDATDREYVVEENGDYTVEVADKEGCKSMSDVVSIVNVGIKNYAYLNKVTLFPNPVAKELFVKGVSNSTSLKVLNIVGKVLQETNGKSIDVSSMEEGLYFLLIDNQKSIPFVKVNTVN